MLPMPRRAADALLAAAALFAASTVTTTTAECVAFNSSLTVGNPEDVSIAEPYHFACSDDQFLMSVNVTYVYDDEIQWLQWSCLNYDDWTVQFTVGITGVQASIADSDYPRLGDLSFGGYDLDYSDADGMSSAWKGPYGEFSIFDDVLSGISGSYCGTDAFATGMTIWTSSLYVYGVKLECATITSTCYPDDYPVGLIEDTSDSPTGSTSTSTSFYYGSSSASTTDEPSYVFPTDDGSSFSSDSRGTSTPLPTLSGSSSSSSTTDYDGWSPTSSDDDDGPGYVSTTDESSAVSTSSVIIIGASVGGSLFLVGIIIGVTVCCICRHRRRESEKHHHQMRTSDAAAVAPAAATVITVVGEQGDVSVYDNEEIGAAGYADEDLPPPPTPPPPPPSAPPVPHGDPPKYSQYSQ